MKKSLFFCIALLITSVTWGQLTGNKTIKSSGGDYATFTLAIDSLNTYGVGAGGVTFNVDADFISVENCPVITATGTAANPIIFQKSGVGANPVIKSNGNTGVADGGIVIKGGDYITFDGIDITINSGSALEFGYYILNASALNGAQYNTIKNCTITLNRLSTISKGINQAIVTPNPTNATGANSYNTYDNNVIQNSAYGIYMKGWNAYPDLSYVIKNNTIGAASPDDILYSGIYGYASSGINIFNNEIRNITGTGVVNGVFIELLKATTNNVYNNKIHDLNSTGFGYSDIIRGIQIKCSAGMSCNVYNNLIYAFKHDQVAQAGSQIIRGIDFVTGTGSIYFNSVSLETNVSTSSTCLYNAGTVNLENNIFANFSPADSNFVETKYCIYNTGTLSSSDYNDFYVTEGPNNFVGYSGGIQPTLADWQTAISSDAHTLSADPLFTSATDFYPQLCSPVIAAGTPTGSVTTDIAGTTRSLTTPTIGAYEATPPNNPTSGGAISADQTGCSPFTTALINTDGLPSGQNGTLEYKWMESTTSNSAAFTDIPGSNTDTFDPGTITQTTWYKRVARVTCMKDWTGAAESNVVTITVNSSLPVSISLAASENPVCSGGSVTLTATPTNGGSTPSFQWKVNQVDAGTNTDTFSYIPSDNDLITCILTSNATCATGNPALSDTVTMLVNPYVAASVSVDVNQNNICAGTSVTYTATPVGGGIAPTYQWYKNTIAVATGDTYTEVPANGDVVYIDMTSNATCVNGSPATSNSVTMTVNPLVAASVSTSVDQNNICAGTSVTVTATPVNGGTPTYQWYKNGSPVGSNLATYSYTPANNDQVYVVLTSDLTCVSGNPATSNTVTLVVTALLTPSVTVAASANPVTAGTSVTFTPEPVNGGTPSHQWYVNGSPAGSGSAYAYVPANGNQVYVVMTSSLACVTSATATSNSIVMIVNAAIPATSTWTGNIDGNWFTAGNWTDGIPGATTLVTVPGGLTNYPTLLSAVTISGITIDNGGSFIGSEFLTTSSALVKRDIVNSNFHFISSPVASTTFGNVFPLNQTEVWNREYNETTGNWDNLTIADFLTVGKGYTVQMNQTQTGLFSGVLNSSPVTLTLAKQNPGVTPSRVGWNLLGNPFTSAIDWDLTDHSAIDGSVYVWNGTQYVSWNGAIGALADGIIPAENCFFAKTTVDGTTLSIPLASRVHSSVGYYKSTLTNMLELTAEGNSFTDKTFIHFNDQASAGFDSQYDAYKLFGIENVPQLYSITGDILSINELPMAGNEVVNLGFKCNTTGTYSISASGIENFSSDVPVFLQDLKLNVSQDMKANPVYSFSYEAGESENRFRLNFADVTGLSEVVNTGIRVFSFNKTVVIENTSLLKGNISIFDITGRKLFSQKLTGQVRTNFPLEVVSGTYIVKVISANGTVNSKVLIQ